jgi:membrane protein DedA with SNARE-associated domain
MPEDWRRQMNLDRRFLIWALSYAAAGLALGIYMAASNNHGELVTHAHILLIGFLLSLVYGIIHKLWLEKPNRTVANIQFVVHQAAAVTVSVGLFLIFGNMVPEPTLGPILAIASAGVLLAMLLMLYMVVRFGRDKTAVETS